MFPPGYQKTTPNISLRKSFSQSKHPLQFTQGSIITLSANFTTPDGVPIDPPDPVVTVFFQGNIILNQAIMTQIKLGWYFRNIDGSTLLPGVYEVLYSGTILGELRQ